MSRDTRDARASANDVTVRLDQLKGRQGRPAPPPAPPPPQDRRGGGGSGGGVLRRPLPRWALPVAIAIGLLFVLLLPLLFYSQPGFTIVVKGAPPNGQIFVDDVRRGIPGIETVDDKVASLVRVQGLKAGVNHTVRINCGGPDGTLSLDGTSGITEVPGVEDGEVVELVVKDCPQKQGPIRPPDEIDYRGKMRLVAKSAFLMGDDQGSVSERPAHVVNIDYDYYIDKYEVTNKQYRDFCTGPRGRSCPKEPEWDPSYSAKPEHPAVGISWNDAKAYCEEAGKRLPTEEEWEKAASWNPKATDASVNWKRRWPWGNEFDPSRARSNSDHTTPVGQFSAGASAYEVYDMAGNIGEWVADNYLAYPGNTVSGGDYGSVNRVLRGGTFITKDADGLRTTRRAYRRPTFSQGEVEGRSSYIGFRCAVRGDDPGLQSQLRQANK